MNQISEIRAQLQPHMGWHATRLSFVFLFLVALFRAKTVNLAELATVWGGNAEEASNYPSVSFSEQCPFSANSAELLSNKFWQDRDLNPLDPG